MIRWTIRTLPSGDKEGMVTLYPTAALPSGHPAGAPIRFRATSKTKAGALAKAASVAQMIAANPLMAAVLPPGTGSALKAVVALSKSAAAGKLRKAAKKYSGKGAKRLIKALKKFW